MLEKIKKRVKPISIAISKELNERIKKACKDHISVSSFIRTAIVKELERIENGHE